ncbi:hypothetical protein ACFX2F_027830 [Malus domestica]
MRLRTARQRRSDSRGGTTPTLRYSTSAGGPNKKSRTIFAGSVNSSLPPELPLFPTPPPPNRKDDAPSSQQRRARTSHGGEPTEHHRLRTQILDTNSSLSSSPFILDLPFSLSLFPFSRSSRATNENKQDTYSGILLANTKKDSSPQRRGTDLVIKHISNSKVSNRSSSMEAATQKQGFSTIRFQATRRTYKSSKFIIFSIW